MFNEPAYPEWIANVDRDDKSIITKLYETTIDIFNTEDIGTSLGVLQDHYIYCVGGCNEYIDLTRLMKICNDIDSSGKIVPLLSGSGETKSDLCFKITKYNKNVSIFKRLTEEETKERLNLYKDILLNPSKIKNYREIEKLYKELQLPIHIILRNIQLYNINDTVDIQPSIINANSTEINLTVTKFTGMIDIRFIESLKEKSNEINKITVNPKQCIICFVLKKPMKSKSKEAFSNKISKITKKKKTNSKIKLNGKYFRVNKKYN